MKTHMTWLNIRPPSDLPKCLQKEGLLVNGSAWQTLNRVIFAQATMSMPAHSLHVLGVRPNLDLRKTILFIVEVIIHV